MTTNIQLLRSSIAYKRPSAAPLLEGQAAINYNQAEPGLFFRLTDGKLAKVGPVAISDNAVAPNAAPAGETGNSTGEEWLDQRSTFYSPVLKVYDGNTWTTGNGFKVDEVTGDFTLDRNLNINNVNADSIFVDGPAVIGGNITPNGQSCAYYLGLTTERWDYFYGCNFDVTNNGLVGNNLTVGNDAVVDNDFSIGRHVISNLIPDVSATRFLGSDSQKWAAAYTQDLYVDGNTTIGTACGASSLNVTAASVFNCSVDFQAPINIDQIGTQCTDTLTIKATTTFHCPVTFKDTVTLEDQLIMSPGSGIKDLYAYGNMVLGDGCGSSTLNINAATTLSCDVLPNANSARTIGSAALKLQATHTVTTNTDQLSGHILLGSVTLTHNALDIGTNASRLKTLHTVNLSGHKLTGSVTVDHNLYDIGTSAARLKAVYAQDVYTGDLHLKNEKGDWTMIEDEDYLTIRNNKNGKTFRLLMEEV